MTTPTITITDATNLVSKFKNGKKAFTTGSNKFASDKRAYLYARLGEAYGVSVSLLALEAAEFGRFCRNMGTNAPGENENPFAACVRILFNGDKSAWKYSKCFRAAQSLGWTEENFAANLEAYKLKVKSEDGTEKQVGRLIGLETLDKLNNGDPEGERSKLRETAARRWFSQQQPLASFAPMQGFPAQLSYETGRMVGLVAEWDAVVQAWHVRHVHQYEDAPAWNLASKRALAEYDQFVIDAHTTRELEKALKEAPEDTDKLMEALDARNSEVDAMNDAPRQQRTVIHREDESGLFSYPEELRVEQGDQKPVEAQPSQQQDAAAN